MKNFEVAVIGGGPGGYVAAIRAAKRGKSTVLFEGDALGGTCLNRGCIPTKSLLNSSELFHRMKNVASEGIFADGLRYDYGLIAARRDQTVAQLRAGISGLLKKAGVTVVNSFAQMLSPTEIEAGGEKLSAQSVILATGSTVFRLPIPGNDLPGVLTSDEVLSLTEPPSSITVIGGGVIGVEFASHFSQLGIPVTILEAAPKLLTGVDSELVSIVAKRLMNDGILIHTGVRVQSIAKGLVTTFTNNDEPQQVESSAVIMAAGRKPVTAGLEKTGVAFDNYGFIQTDEFMRTNIPNIYAIGDVTGKDQLAHVASSQGITAADNIAGVVSRMRYNAIPSCIYTSPEIACIGLTEQQAKEKGYKVKTGRFPGVANGRSLIQGGSDGLVKLVINETNGEILGAHLCTVNATEMISELSVAMAAEATIEELGAAIHPHPTVNEMIMEAAHDVKGLCVHQ